MPTRCCTRHNTGHPTKDKNVFLFHYFAGNMCIWNSSLSSSHLSEPTGVAQFVDNDRTVLMHRANKSNLFHLQYFKREQPNEFVVNFVKVFRVHSAHIFTSHTANQNIYGKTYCSYGCIFYSQISRERERGRCLTAINSHYLSTLINWSIVACCDAHDVDHGRDFYTYKVQ